MEEDKENRTLAAILAAKDINGLRVLEIGCGDGRVTAMLAGLPQSLIALDPDAASTARARSRIAGAAFLTGSGEAPPFADGRFDAVLFTLSLHHQDPARALHEAWRLLGAGGCILAIEPEPDGEIERICCLVEDECRDLACAARALAPFPTAYEKKFSTDWIFDGRTDLYRWLFDYYNRAFDPGVVRRVDRLLGPRVDRRPLHLQDDLRIVRIDKEPVHDR